MSMRGKSWVLAACLVLASPASAAEPPAKVTPVASVSSIEGAVDISGASAKYGAVIAPGSGVTTSSNAHVDLIFKDAFRVQLPPDTTFYVFGKPAPKGAKKPVVSDCSLVSGSLRIVTISAGTVLLTPAGKVTFAAATEAKVHVENGVTRVSVYAGKATVGATQVAAGQGVKVDKGASSGKATKLLDPPTWTAPPQVAVTTAKDTAAVTSMLRGKASKWHIEVAVDESFSTFVMDQQAVASGTTLVFEQTLPIGKYWFRVAALGADGLESPWTTVAPSVITKAVVVAKAPEKPVAKKK